MSVTLNAKGTSVPYFTIGKNGTTLYQGSSDPTGSYTVKNGDLWIDSASNALKVRSSGSWTPPSLGPLSFPNSTGTSGQILTTDGAGNLYFSSTGAGSVTSVSVVTNNGFAGTVSNASSTPAITLSTTVSGILRGNGTSIVAAVAGDFPTLNQNTTGSAAFLTTSRSISATGDASWTVNFDGSANASAALTLATVNTNTGSFGSASSVPTFTVNGKGLITAASNTSIQIAETQITNGTIFARNADNETITGNWTFNNPVVGADPTSASNFATKQYVDNAVAGLTWKSPVLVATTTNITLSGTQTIDGVSVVAGNRVLVKNQNTTSENGIYVVSAGSWTRATDFDSITPIDEINGAAVFVVSGTTQADTGWTETSLVTSVGTDPITFVQFSAAGAYTAGAGLSLTGNTFNVGTASTSRIVVNVDDIDLATVADSGTGSFLKITRDSYGRVSGTTSVTASDITGLVDNTYVNVSGDTMTGALSITASGGQLLTVKSTTASSATTSKFLNSGDVGITLLQYGPSYASGSVFNVGANGTTIASDAGLFGIGTTNAQPVIVGTNGSERLRVTSDGSVQIGSSTGSNIGLFVYKNGTDPAIQVRQDGAGTIQTWTRSGGALAAQLDTNGNLGIGVVPTYRVDATAGNGNGYRYTGGTGQIFLGETSNLPAVGSISNHALLFLTNSSERARLDASGNLGIGVTPSYKLDVAAAANGATTPTARIGGIRPFYLQPGTGSTAIYGPVLGMGAYVDTSSGQYIQPSGINMTGGAAIAAPYAGGLQFYSYDAGVETGTTQTLANTIRMTMTAGGQLWLNRTSDSGLGLLQVNSGGAGNVADFVASGSAYVNIRGAASSFGGLRIAGNGGTVGTNSLDIQQDSSSNVDIVNRANTRMSFYTNGGERMRIANTGEIGINAGPVAGRQLTIGGSATGVRVLGGTGSNTGSFVEFVAQGVQAGYLGTQSGILGGTANNTIINYAAGAWAVYAGGNLSLNVTSGGVIQDAAGLELGWKRIPQSTTTTGNLVAGDVGRHVPASGGITVPQNVFSIGDAITVFNNTAGNITITQGTGVTLRFAGTASTGNRTLAQRGIVTILCVGSNEFVISGAGLT